MSILAWVILGIVLVIFEPVVPGFCIFFFGLGALTVAAVLALVTISVLLQWLLFPVASLIFVALLFRYLKIQGWGRKSISEHLDDDLTGRIVHVTMSIHPPEAGRVIVGDAEWNAVADCPVETGATVRIVRHENLTVWVEKIS